MTNLIDIVDEYVTNIKGFVLKKDNVIYSLMNQLLEQIVIL
jgi:hypothetical protein